MKKITITILSAVALVGTAMAGPTIAPAPTKTVQPCVTPCFRDQEWQFDIFYSYNAAQHKGGHSGSTTAEGPTFTTPAAGFAQSSLFPAGSSVAQSAKLRTAGNNQYFNDGSGGGVGLSYFFLRYIGVGIEGNWWNGCRSGQFNGSLESVQTVTPPAGSVIDLATLKATAGANTSVALSPDGNSVVLTKNFIRSQQRAQRDAANQLTGNLILRYPFEGPICWAPYIFGGGGGIWDGQDTGFGDVGIGVEFRVTSYMGFFADWRWEFMGGNNGNIGNASRTFTFVDPATGLAKNQTLRMNNWNTRKNDVNMTRVGIRFVF